MKDRSSRSLTDADYQATICLPSRQHLVVSILHRDI
jgi:hypothetical protein